MTDQAAPKITKWPFLAADVVLLVAAGFIATNAVAPLGAWSVITLGLCVLAGAGVCVAPFVLEYRAGTKLAEYKNFSSSVQQIDNVRNVANQITFATAQWQMVQEQAGKTITAARDISERMTKESQAFSEFMLKANDAEKAHLRLEVEKLHRNEGEWLHTVIRIMDHVYALYLAGVKSGQDNLRTQLGNFQNACREAARRLGVSPFEAKADEVFDEKRHQLPDAKAKALPGSKVGETLATGFTFQGKVLRPAVVTLKAPTETEPQQTELLEDEEEDGKPDVAARG
ncbi:MAG TPA: nucleotide exchange factor GrpE [Verrucomicrobiae bacterium]|nr:nucleotide exchange factor GrpE [Verrucomicrobiae bacterium]